MKIGLVLSGGGGKGAYELGVWRALKELNIDKYIEVFSGSSIGAFNAVLFAEDNIDQAENLWKEITMEQLAPVSKRILIQKGIELAIGWKCINFAKKYMAQSLESGIVTKDGARGVVNKYLNIKEVKRREKICYAACTELPDFKARYFKINDHEEEVGKEIIIASSSLPRIYVCTEILGKKYIDGGVSDNTPIKPVYDEGCDIIIVVLLSKEASINRALYPNTHIIEISPNNLNESTINGTLNLDQISKERRISEGYKDTKNLLLPIIKLGEFKKELELREKNLTLGKLYNWAKKMIG
ncbi:patatin-like phospholipase family protein [Clostridium sp.]|uniref:patatin-like phospholipase family protein n=1 Tax=Clostridium sp. TaxID=1506 RepID=UPI003F2CE643